MKRLLAPVLVALIGTLIFCSLFFLDFDDLREKIAREQAEQNLGTVQQNDEPVTQKRERSQDLVMLDNRIYDALLRIKPPIEEEEVLFLVMDDDTITEIDEYPLSRDITARGLILLKEFDPAWTMLDIEFVDKSPMSINRDFLDYEVPEELYSSYDFLIQNYTDLINSILNGKLDRDTALEYMTQLTQMGQAESESLYEYIRGVALDRDALLGKTIDYMDQASVTLNVVENSSLTLTQKERDDVAVEYAVTDKLILNVNPFPIDNDILPSIPEVIMPAAWAGFPRMHIDKDGVRRRIDILYESRSDGNYYSHMGFGTWWINQGDGTLKGAPEIIGTARGITVGDIDIPLDKDGKLIINYPKRLFDGTPLNRRDAEEWTLNGSPKPHLLSFLELYYHDQLWSDVENYISELEYLGYGSAWAGFTDRPLSAFSADLEGAFNLMFESGDGSGASEYSLYRDEFLQLIMSYVESGILDDIIYSLEDALLDPELPAEQVAIFEEDREYLPILFDEILWRVENLLAMRSKLRAQVAGKTVVVGYTGSSTTDIGANPFESKYMNVGIYGAVYNTLVQAEFLQVSPWWATSSIVLLSGLALAFLGLVAQKKSGLNTSIGILFMLLVWAACAMAFISMDFYIHMLPVILVTLLTFLASLGSNYFTATRKRAEIQGMFGKFISPIVVNILTDQPELMETSGDQRDITALFTDIEGFSTITEHLGSSEKVFEFLERYLAPMCDIILDERGTIDKFEGDAIIAFWNAPLDQDRHQFHACHAVMRMIEKEKELCEQFRKEGLLNDEVFAKIKKRNPDAAGRLFTRFGLNSGQNNVGFIGTTDRKDYTALGDEMNLAARLEGANKLYGTQVLISQEVYDVVRDEFFTRRMDRVRVVGRDKPVSLHQLSYSKDIGGFSDIERKSYVHYQTGLDLFYEQKWDESEAEFKKALKSFPGDKPPKVFIDRCAAYRKNPPPKNWDGVYTMTKK